MKRVVPRSADLMCRTVRGLGPAAGKPGVVRRPLAAHVSSCLRCQADLARYRRLRRELGRLAQRIEVSPVPIAPRVARAISPELALAGPPRHNARLAATIAGATAAAASTVVFALWRRTRAAA
jgi:anti-sigma factor RsiW